MEKAQIKILLIHPPVNKDLRIQEGLKYPPMGIAFLAAVITEAGYNVCIFDGNVEKGPFNKLKHLLEEYHPDVIGISFTSLLAESAHLTAKFIKEFNPGITIIAGGYHTTVMPLEVMSDNNFDFAVIGEGEETIIEWLSNFSAGKDTYENIKGLVLRSKGKTIVTEQRPLIPDLDSLPMPAYGMLPLDQYSSLLSTRKPYVTFIRSRGCPFRCIFCGVQRMFGRKYRCQSPQKTISEIDFLIQKFGVKEILFKDSDFLIDKTNVENLCDLLIERKYDLIWSCNARVDMVDLKILSLMKKAGCKMVTYGVESGDQEILNQLKKDITVRQVIEAVEAAKKAHLQCTVNIIFGNPGETRDSVLQTINFVRDIDPDYGNFAYLTAFPGSELYDLALRHNWFIDGKPDSFGYEELKLNATRMTKKELSKVLEYATKSFYFRPRYIIKRLRQMNFRELKKNIKGLLAILKTYK